MKLQICAITNCPYTATALHFLDYDLSDTITLSLCPRHWVMVTEYMDKVFKECGKYCCGQEKDDFEDNIKPRKSSVLKHTLPER